MKLTDKEVKKLMDMLVELENEQLNIHQLQYILVTIIMILLNQNSPE